MAPERSLNLKRSLEPTLDVVLLAWSLVLARYGTEADPTVAYDIVKADPISLGSPVWRNSTFYQLKVPFVREQTVAEALKAVAPTESSTQTSPTFQDTGKPEEPWWSPSTDWPRESTLDNWTESTSLFVRSPADTNNNNESATEGPSNAYLTSRSLVVGFCASAEEIYLEIVYRSLPLPEWLTTRVLIYWKELIESIAGTNTETCLAELPTLSKHDEAQLRSWSPGSRNKATHGLIHEQIIQVCKSRPEVMAVCAWDGDLSYEELDELSTRLARHLRALNLGHEAIIPIYMEKSKWVSVAILGVLKSGAAFVLFDVSFPANRLREMCRQARSEAIITSQQTKATAQHLCRIVLTILDESSACLRPGVAHAQEMLTSKPRDTAFVLFTSGSTGAPKGIVVDHLAWMSAADRICAKLNISHLSRIVQFSSHAFDAAVSDHLLAFMTGGCVCIPSENQRRADLPEVTTQMQANWLLATPSVIRAFQPQDLPTLQTIVMGGEGPSVALIDMWRPHVQVFQVYGPAECCLCVTAYDYSGDAMVVPSRLGQTFSGNGWIVDQKDHNKLVPLGAVGELVIEGANVSRGYLNDAAKTAQAYLKEVQWQASYERNQIDPVRFYKTGDLARFLNDGCIEYVARRDRQVKIRGQRVELPEIESQFSRCFPMAGEVAVEITQVSGGIAHLTAFVTFNDQNQHLASTTDSTGIGNQSRDGTGDPVFLIPSLKARELRDHARMQLQQHLPSYMVPAMFIFVSHIPQTATGKTDRRRLREMTSELAKPQLAVYRDDARPRTQGRRIPETEEELSLQQLVAEILNCSIEDVAMEEDFLHLGGDSASAMKLISLARRENILIPVSDLMTKSLFSLVGSEEKGVTAHISNDVANVGSNIVWHLDVEDEKVFINDTIIPLLHGVSDFSDVVSVMPATELQEVTLFGYPCDYWLFHLGGILNEAQLQAACESLVQQHAILRAAFVPFQGRMLQVILNKFAVPYSVFELPSKGDEIMRTFCTEDATSSTGFGVPLVSFTLFKYDDPTRHTLAMRISHAQSDAHTLAVLACHLSTLYRGETLSITSDYPRYRREAHAQATKTSWDTWRSVLKGSFMTDVRQLAPPPLAPFPTSGRQAVTETESRATPEPTIDDIIFIGKMTSNIKPPKGITAAILAQAAWGLTLSYFAGTRDVVYTQVVHGRGLPLQNVELVAGECIRGIPVRVNLQQASPPTAMQLMRDVQQQHLQTLPHQCLDQRDIIQNSTSWPTGEPIRSWFLYQDVAPIAPLTMSDASGQNQVSLSFEELVVPVAAEELALVVTPHSDYRFEIQILTCSTFIARAVAEQLLQKVCHNLSVMSSHPETPLSEF